jgi:hypothetical protein
MRPSTASSADLLSHHQDHQYNPIASASDTTSSTIQSSSCSTPPPNQFLSYTSTMPENSFQADI